MHEVRIERAVCVRPVVCAARITLRVLPLFPRVRHHTRGNAHVTPYTRKSHGGNKKGYDTNEFLVTSSSRSPPRAQSSSRLAALPMHDHHAKNQRGAAPRHRPH
jgi:hypothetical protein